MSLLDCPSRDHIDFPGQAVQCFCDSNLLVQQMQGKFKIKHPEIQKLAYELKMLIQKLPSFSISYIPRIKNKIADKLANQAIDKNK